MSLAVITRRPLVSFLVIWTHIWPSYRHSYLADRWYKCMIHSGYRDPLYMHYFYLRGCMSSLYFELDLSEHCGTFIVRFLVKNRTGWTTHLAYSEQLIRRWYLVVGLSHVYPTWHAYVAHGHPEFSSLAWHVGHVIPSSSSSYGRVLALGALLLYFLIGP